MVATPDTTTQAPTCTPNAASGVSVTQSASDWGNSAFVQLIGSSGFTLSAWGFAFMETSAETEFDLAVGGAGAEVVVGTCATWAASGGYTWSIAQFAIPIEIPAGSRISVRTRKAGTTTSAYLIKLLYYPSVGATYGAISDGVAVAPSAASAVSVTTGAGAWQNSSYGELSASLTDCVLLGVVIDGPTTNSDYYELDIAKGAALSEVVVATTAWAQGNNAMLHHFIPFGVPILVSGTNRISFRARHNTASAVAVHCKLQYIPFSKLSTSSLVQGTTALHGCTPDASALLTQASNNSANWAQSNWLALDSSTATAQCLTGITIDLPGVTANEEYEMDVGVGGAGSEALIATVADSHYALSGPSNTLRFLIPVDAIPASSRVSIRFRKGNTTARTVGFGYEYIRKPL